MPPPAMPRFLRSGRASRGSPGRVALAVVLGVLLAASERARADDPKVVEDADYRFRLQLPGVGWRLLAESEARRMVPDAVAGAVRGEIFGAVIVEEVGGLALEALPPLLIGNMSLEDRRATEPEPIELLGRKALRWRTSGRVNGLPMTYQHVVFLNGGFAYQLVNWGLTSKVAGDGSSFAPFVEAFWLLEGPVRGRDTTQTVRDATGVGWRVKEGLFQSAAYRLQVEPPAGWRLAIGTELRGMNANAEVGLVSANPECYLILIVERAAGEDREAFLRHVEESFLERLGGDVKPDRLPVSVDGRAVALRETAVSGPPAVDFLHGAFFEGDLCVQVMGWHLTPHRERARGKLVEGLAGIRFLGATEATTLARELESGPDVQNRVAETWSIRRGTYRDFERRFTWSKPAGWWRLHAGAEARESGELAVLHLEEPSRGIFGLVVAEPVGETTSEAFHRSVVEKVFPEGAPGGEPETFDLGAAVGLATAGRRKTNDLNFRWRAASAVHGGTGYQMLFWGTVDNMKSAARAVEDAIQGFRFHDELTATASEDGDFRDERLGYAMASLGEGWDLRPKGVLEDVGPIGSSVVWRAAERQEVTLGAICALEEGQDESWMVALLTGMIAEHASQELRGRTPQREKTELAGQPAEWLRWPGSGVDVLLTSRDRTFYFLVSEHRGPPVLPLDELKSRFSLLD